jgi:hypothetical protein
MSQYIGRMLKIMYILCTNIPMIPSDEYGKKCTNKTKDPSSISFMGRYLDSFCVKKRKYKKSVEFSMNVFYNIHTTECMYVQYSARCLHTKFRDKTNSVLAIARHS